MGCEVVILSHKRAGRVTTHRHVAGALVCVPEGQVEEYARYHPRETLVVHPDGVVGLMAKRQWIYKIFGDVMMLDDDSLGMYRAYREQNAKQKAVVPPDRCRAIIEDTANIARKLGVFLFGFNSHCHPRAFNPNKPFKFGGYSPGGAMGLLKGSKLFFPNLLLVVDDYWIHCLNAYYHRYEFMDMRFASGFNETYVGVGGLQEFREKDGEVKGTKWLKQKFGNVIQPKKLNKVITKKNRNLSARTIVLPWKY
jgi:hypothetical protein